MKRFSLIGLILLLTAVHFSGSVMARQTLPGLDELHEGWTAISPGGDTTCALDTPYTFFVRPGASDHLLVEFQGGGFCWDAGTCGLRMSMRPTFEPTVEAEEINDYTAGIFDVNNDENPFKDYNILYVAYCTGDGHLGDNVVTYGEGDEAMSIHHKGYANANSALDWMYQNFPDPDSIFVTGCSAGSVASPFYADAIADHYGDVPVAQLGDAGGGYRVNLTLPFTAWGTVSILPDLPEFEGITPSELSFEDLYVAAAAHHPEVTFSQVNTAGDYAQSAFIRLFIGPTISTTLLPNLEEIAQAAPNFRSYTAWGSAHCLTSVPEFYTYQVNGVRLRDWVADIVAGEDVVSVQCTDCKAEELYAP